MPDIPDRIHLSTDEARFLVLHLLDAVEAMDDGRDVPDTWAGEARLWADLLLNRLKFGEDDEG